MAERAAKTPNTRRSQRTTTTRMTMLMICLIWAVHRNVGVHGPEQDADGNERQNNGEQIHLPHLLYGWVPRWRSAGGGAAPEATGG